MQDIQVRNFSSTFVFCAQKMFSLTTLPYSSHNPSLFAFCINIIFKMIIFFFFNDPATTEIYTFPLHDALPISLRGTPEMVPERLRMRCGNVHGRLNSGGAMDDGFDQRAQNLDSFKRLGSRHRVTAKFTLRSEEHTSELQSPCNLVCRLLLEKKK